MATNNIELVNAQTSMAEPETTEVTAETETETQVAEPVEQKLFAGKYKNCRFGVMK